MPKQSATPKSTYVSQPFLGLFLDRPPWQIDPHGFSDCLNVRIYLGTVTNSSMGWFSYLTTQLNGPITLIQDFQQLVGTDLHIAGTPTDLYQYTATSVSYITPQYITGTVSINNGSAALVGVGTSWATSIGGGYRNNVQVGDQIFIGAANQTALAPVGGWYTVLSVTDNTHLTLTTNFTGTTVSGVAYTARQLFGGGTTDNRWSADSFPNAGSPLNSDVFIAVNGIDPVVLWNGQTVAAQFQTAMPFVAHQVRRFNNLMVYGNLLQAGAALPTSIANSDNGLPTTMTGGVAGQYVVTGGPYQIAHLGILGNLLMIYMGGALGGDVVGAQFIGAPNFFAFNEIIKGRGPLGVGLVAEFPDRHQFISTDGEYRYNGLFIQLMNTHIWRGVLPNFDLSRANMGFVTINQEFGDLIWAIPLLTDNGTAPIPLTTAFVEHYLEQAQNYLFKPFTKRDYPFTTSGLVLSGTSTTFANLPNGFNTYNIPWDFFPAVRVSYPLTIVGDVNGFLYGIYTGQSKNGAAMNSFVKFGQRMTMGERSRGLVKRVYVFGEFQTSQILSVTLTMRDQIGGAATITDVQSINLNYSGNRFTTHYRRGRTFEVQIATSSATANWSLDGYDVDVVDGGKR